MDFNGDLAKTLREYLMAYREKKKHLSLRSIANNSGVSRYFLNKIQDEDLEKVCSLDCHQVLLFLRFIHSTNSLKSTIDSESGELKEALIRVFYADYENTDAGDNLNIIIPDELLLDFDQFLILSLATHKTMTLRVVKKLLGPNRHYKIETLVERDYIRIDDGKVSLCQPGEFRIPPYIFELHVPEIIKRFFSIENSAKKRCVISFYHQSVSRKTWIDLHTLHQNFQESVAKLISNGEVGEYPVFSVVSFDTFFSHKEVEKIRKDNQ